MRKLSFAAIAIAFMAAASWACVLELKLVGPDGKESIVRPGSAVTLARGAAYTLVVRYVEDHGNCKIAPEKTAFILGDEKWRPAKEGQALALKANPSWVDDGRSAHVARLEFIAALQGPVTLEIVRDCPKGGIDELVRFDVR